GRDLSKIGRLGRVRLHAYRQRRSLRKAAPTQVSVGDELAVQLEISRQAIEEAIRRKLLTFDKHRNSRCWRFGDNGNGCFRRVDGKPFKICGKPVKAEAETRGQAWHRLIGLDDVVANDRREILLTPEGTKDGLAAFHFADAEETLSHVGVVMALGAAIKLRE